MEIQIYTREQGGETLRRQIQELECCVWPGGGPFPTAPESHAISFVCLENGRAVSHTAVRQAVFSHCGERYHACGLSEVATHPDYRGRGLASELIRRAERYIAALAPDLSVFTCAPERVEFYRRAGWEPVPSACLVGRSREKPFRSDELGLITLLRCYAPKAVAHYGELKQGDLCIELGEGNLW